jgi:hypothetical protein
MNIGGTMNNILEDWAYLLPVDVKERYTYNSFLNQLDIYNEWLPNVCIDLSRSLKRLGITNKIESYRRVDVVAIKLAVKTQDLEEGVREIFGNLRNLHAKGLLMGYYEDSLSYGEDMAPDGFSSNNIVCARPMIKRSGVDYAETLSCFFDKDNFTATIHEI